MLTLITETKLTRRKVRRPEPGARPIRRALRIIASAHEPKGKGPAVRIRWKDLVHDAVREEADQSVPSRRYVDAFSAVVDAFSAVAIHINPKRAAIVPTYVDIEFRRNSLVGFHTGPSPAPGDNRYT